jgi:hypothetical protein
MACAIYVRDNTMHRSESMTATFDLDELPGDGAATLSLHAQDSDDKDMPPAEIRILVNDVDVFSGPTSAVKWNWSWQTVDLPAGVLKAGTNTVKIVNISKPETVKFWHQRWFLLTDATIKYDTP